MRDKHTGRSRGFAFVTFETHNIDTLHALKQQLLHPKVPHVIQDRKIEVREGDGNKPADSFLGKVAAQQSNSHFDQQQLMQNFNGGGDRGRNRSNRRDRGGHSPQGGKDRNFGNRDRQGGGGGNRPMRNRSRSRDR